MSGTITAASLPERVENLIGKICNEKHHPPPCSSLRQRLADAGEAVAFDVLSRVYNQMTPIKTLDGLIIFLIRESQKAKNLSSPGALVYQNSSPAISSRVSPSPQTLQIGAGPSGVSPLRDFHHLPASVTPEGNAGAVSSGSRTLKRQVDLGSPSSPAERSNKTCRQLFSHDSKAEPKRSQSYQATVFSRELDYRREFLIYNYIGWEKLEDVVSEEDADDILGMKDIAMDAFEFRIWNAYGHKYRSPEDRRQGLDWSSGQSFLYYCQVSGDGNCQFKGPHLSAATTHLQRTLGDENVLIVKFIDVQRPYILRILKEGIRIGLKCFRFFALKDEGKNRKKNEGGETKVSTAFRCYFINLNSLPAFGNYQSYVLPINDSRCHFMHIHMVSSLVKYLSRFSLILSKTIKLPIDLSKVVIERIDDISCLDHSGRILRDDTGEVLILTDGTGFISEDLAMKCPQNFTSAKYVKQNAFQSFSTVNAPHGEGLVEACNKDPPLLMQCRLFHKGTAVKGTLLINRKLGAGKIQIRPSMVKVERDVNCSIAPTFDSLEIVGISHKPRRCQLSKNLIALLSYGGVPRTFFMDLLTRALEQSRTMFFDPQAAVKVAMTNGDDDNVTAARMISSGVPLHEPHLQARLTMLAHQERKSLSEGKLTISESFYLMGTTDPTGILNRDQVCVILENGQISGKVLVYRNPGLHFGDVHILDAVYVKEMEDIVGNAKYGIFFSTKGHRSVATEMGNGDFDGDNYWVSRNPRLLEYFNASPPWTRIYSTPSAVNKKPVEYAEDLEMQIFQLILDKQQPSYSMAVAADSWMAFMDRLLILGDSNPYETEELTKKILQLIDLYYDALDAPKSGKTVNIPRNLIAEKFPHYMRKSSSYESVSVLGEIFQVAELFQCVNQPTTGIWKLPCFDVEIPPECIELWKKRYTEYRFEMANAMEIKDADIKKSAANGLIEKYKQILYHASDLHQSTRNIGDIYNDALALYHVVYDHALFKGDVRKCGFAWRVAASALCRYHSIHSSPNQDPILMVPSVLRSALS